MSSLFRSLMHPWYIDLTFSRTFPFSPPLTSTYSFFKNLTQMSNPPAAPVSFCFPLPFLLWHLFLWLPDCPLQGHWILYFIFNSYAKHNLIHNLINEWNRCTVSLFSEENFPWYSLLPRHFPNEFFLSTRPCREPVGKTASYRGKYS